MNWAVFEQKLLQFNTKVYFSKKAERDFKSFSKGKKNDVLLLILKQVQKGAALKPEGNGNQLNPPLHQFAKIKNKAISLRVIYRPILANGITEMQIIAVEPRDKSKVYQMATERIDSFFKEINEKDD